MAITTEFKSAGVFGIERAPAQAPVLFSPAKMGLIGWTQKGPSNSPIEVRSVEEFTRAFGPLNTNGIVPQSIRAFFGTGGESSWVSRVVPADAISAFVDIDDIPGPTKWTFTANGEGTWGNDLKVQIRGNINFLNQTTFLWDKFDLLILQPADFDPQFDEAAEVYEQVQFNDPSAADYILNVITDPRNPSLLVTLTAGAGGTPVGLLPTIVGSESIGTGGGAPLISQFSGTLLNVPVLENTLKVTAITGSTKHEPHAPTAGAIDGANQDFSLQLVNLPVVEESARIFYQKREIENELLSPSTGLIDGANKDFTFDAGVIANAVHREDLGAPGDGFFRLKYGSAAVGPATLTTIGAADAAVDLSTLGPLGGLPVHPGTLSITVNVAGVGLATITDDGAGLLQGTNGSLPGGGTVDYDAGTLTGITAALEALSDVDASHITSDLINHAKVQTLETTITAGAFAPGDTLTGGTSLATGVVLSISGGVMKAQVTSAANFAVPEIITGSGPGTATLDLEYFSNLEQGVPLITDVDGAGTNTIDHVDDPDSLDPGSGAIDVTTLVAPIAGTQFYLDYVCLGNVWSDTSGNLLGDVATSSSVNFDTGAVDMTATFAPLAGSTIDLLYDTGQFVQDDGLGNIVGDVDANGANTINYNTGEYDFTFETAPAAATPIVAEYVKLARTLQFEMAGGDDGSVISRADISAPALEVAKKGIYALDSVEEPLNVVVPDFEGSEFVQADIVDFCDNRQDRYAIFSFANGFTVPEAIQYNLVTQAWDTKNAAIYYPNIFFVNDLTNLPELLPASPFVAGVYAKTASNKNVGKSPAGIVDGALDAAGIVGPEFKLSRDEQDDLYQARINPLVTSVATGFYVNGARGLSRELRWRYINARQLHIFLMFQTRLQLQWTVFENNGPALWAKIFTALDGFYSSLFRLGYFAGTTKEQAFFIKVDDRNNNQATIDAGQVIIDIGFSPNKPAEFVIFNLSQPAGTQSQA